MSRDDARLDVTLLPDVREVASALSLLAGRGAGVLLGVGTSVLLARGLGAASRGELAELVAWAAIGSQVAALGFSSSLPYFIAMQPGSCRGLLRRALRAASAAWLLSCAAATVALGLGLLPQLAAVGAAGMLSVAALAWSSTCLLLMQSAALGMGWLQLFAWTDVLCRALGGMFVGALLLAGTQSPVGAAGALVAAALVSAVPIAMRIRGTGSTAGIRPVSAVEETRYGMRSWSALTLAVLCPRGITLWLAARASAEEVGRFAVALGIAETLVALLSIVSQTRIARMAGSVSSGHGLLRDGTRTLAIVLVASGIAVSAAYLAGPLVIPLLFGEAFAPSVGLLQGMLPVLIALPAAGAFQTMLAARGMPWLSSLAPAFALSTAAGVMMAGGCSTAEQAARLYAWTGWAFLAGAMIAVAWDVRRIDAGGGRARDGRPPGLPPENAYGSRSRILWMHARLTPGGRVAEFGCGTGLMLTAPLRRLGTLVEGWDVHAPSIEEGKSRLERWGEEPGILHAEPFEQARERGFDAIIASEVLEHLDDRQLTEVLALFRTRLRPGGQLLVTVPNGYGWFELDRSLYRLLLVPAERRLGVVRAAHGAKQVVLGDRIVPEYPSTLADDESPHVQWFTMRSIVRRLEEAGFKVERAEGSTLFAGPIADLLITGVPGLMGLNLLAGRVAGRFASGFRLAATIDRGAAA